MDTTNVREILKQEIDSLPEVLTGEVLDFVQFLKERHAEEAYLWRQVQEAQVYRKNHPGEVVTITAEEWETLTAQPEDEE